MFTGIITATAKVIKKNLNTSGMVLVITQPKKWKVKIGASITINGVCSTLKKTQKGLTFEYMPESLKRSTLSDLTVGSLVNLEQSMRADDRLDGHIVQGHVDTVGKIITITPEGNSYIFTIEPRDKKYLKMIAEKGSIAIDGISLTITATGKNNFKFKIIPYTWEHTNLSTKQSGDMVNIEIDVLA
ncbi:MAG TPA: riboflavin synthase, partial [Candidatus Magasanikbacteria bacterium]|nr:riboflavin synthase [Candidatus Magasanikbacteria bacterium]